MTRSQVSKSRGYWTPSPYISLGASWVLHALCYLPTTLKPDLTSYDDDYNNDDDNHHNVIFEDDNDNHDDEDDDGEGQLGTACPPPL